MSAKSTATIPENGTELFVPLNKLKKSPKNARRVPHSETAIDAYAASIAAKGILQNLVVEPEVDAEGKPTGFYLVTIGEGRRLAQLLRVKRKEIKKTEPIRCIVDSSNDPHEISLDENVTRENMHPADQFEAFKKLADERGMLGLRLNLSEQPDVAIIAVSHALAAQIFYVGADVHVVGIQPVKTDLAAHAVGIEDTPAGKAWADRHANWARQMPRDVTALWAFVAELDHDSHLALLAHCIALTVNAVKLPWEKKPRALVTADRLAEAVALDMTSYWRPSGWDT